MFHTDHTQQQTLGEYGLFHGLWFILVRTKSECGNHGNTSYAFYDKCGICGIFMHPKPPPSAYSHIIMCVFICVFFFPPHSPVRNSRCIQGSVVQTQTGKKSPKPSILCTSSSVTIVIYLETICLTGDCSKTPGDLWQTRFPAADWHLSQRSGICLSREPHPGRGRTCRPDPAAPPVSACALNRSSAKH